MSFPWFVARRYLSAKRKQAFISLISGVSIVGVGVGVMAVIIALALMTGVQGELRDRIVGSTAHIYVYKTGGSYGTDLAAEMRELMIPGVLAAAPTVTGVGLLSSNAADNVAAQIKGIDPALEPQVTDIRKSLISGSLEALVNRPPDAKEGIVLGVDLARSLGVRVGDQVWLVTGQLVVGPGIARPRTRPHEVVGIVRFGFYQVDAAAAFLALESAEDVLGKTGPDLLQLRVANLDDAPRLRGELEKKLGSGYLIDDWTEINRELYSALWLEKVGISLAVGLVVVVAALNIVASLVLLVMEKTRDIAILRTMGASAQAIRRIFVYQGLAIGFVGTGAGAVLGLVMCFLADRYQLLRLPSDVYQITHVPFRVLPLDFTVVVVSALAICFVATIYPSRRAGRLDPAEALRNQ